MRAPRSPAGHRRWFALVFGAALATSCLRSPEPVTVLAPPCGASRVLSGNGVGALRIGMSLDSLRAACEVVHDTVIALGAEGLPEHRITVRLDSVLLEANLDDGRVQRITVTDSTLRTADALGVGSRAGAFDDLDATVVSGEGNVVLITPRHCGMSFRLGGVSAARVPTFAQLSDTVRVNTVWIFGCADALP